MYLTAGGMRQRGDVLSGGSYISSNDPRVHFGLGDADKVDAVEIHWPSGFKEKVNLPGVDKIFTVEEGKGVTGQTPAAKAALMMDQNMQFPHRRFDPLRGRWVLVSPHRTQRPWQGEVSRTDVKPALHYDPNCYLCPGNIRAGGKQNPQYSAVFAFTNDYSALLPDSPQGGTESGHRLLVAESERGVCRVLCFHPDHSLTLAGMEVADIVRVVEAWTAEFIELGCAAGDSSRADIRESRRHDGGQQSSPPLPDLGHRTYSRRAGCGAGQPARLSPAA